MRGNREVKRNHIVPDSMGHGQSQERLRILNGKEEKIQDACAQSPLDIEVNAVFCNNCIVIDIYLY